MILFQLQNYYTYAVQGVIIIAAVLLTFVEFGGNKKEVITSTVKEGK